MSSLISSPMWTTTVSAAHAGPSGVALAHAGAGESAAVGDPAVMSGIPGDAPQVPPQVPCLLKETAPLAFGADGVHMACDDALEPGRVPLGEEGPLLLSAPPLSLAGDVDEARILSMLSWC